jgi:hypothetical protein
MAPADTHNFTPETASAEPGRGCRSTSPTGRGRSQAARTRRRQLWLLRVGIRMQIALAIPDGSRRARTEAEFFEDLDQDDELVLVRADRRRNVAKVAEVLAAFAEWENKPGRQGEEMTTMPTWQELMDRTGLSRSTVADILRWLRERGRLGVVETGSTPEIRAGALWPLPDPHADEDNRAAVYVLCVPKGEPDEPEETEVDQPAGLTSVPADSPVDGTRTPPRSVFGAGNSCPARAREETGQNGKRSNEGGGLWKTSVRPCGKREQLAAAEAARWADPVLRRLSARHVRHLLAPWWSASWTVDDALYALNARPDGTPWPYAYQADELRHVPGWIRHRLAAWTTPDGRPGPSRSQRRAAAAARDRVEQRRRQAAEQARHQAAVDAREVAAIKAARFFLLADADYAGRLQRVAEERMRDARRRGVRGEELERYRTITGQPIPLPPPPRPRIPTESPEPLITEWATEPEPAPPAPPSPAEIEAAESRRRLERARARARWERAATRRR